MKICPCRKSSDASTLARYMPYFTSFAKPQANKSSLVRQKNPPGVNRQGDSVVSFQGGLVNVKHAQNVAQPQVAQDTGNIAQEDRRQPAQVAHKGVVATGCAHQRYTGG